MELSDIAYIFFVLIILTGVMYSLLFLVKKYLFKQGKADLGNVNIKVLTTQPLMPKKFISIVKIHKNYFVLGISDNAINLIEKLDDVTDEDFQKENKTKKSFDFLKMLKDNMSGK